MLDKNDAPGLIATVDFKRFADQLDGYADQPAGTILFHGKRVEYQVNNCLMFVGGKLYHTVYEFRADGRTFVALPYLSERKQQLVEWKEAKCLV